MKKKAILDVQFNWIFIAIAGALILMFFVSIVMKQKTASEDTISSTILVNLEPILTGAAISTGTVNILDIPNKEIEMGCNRYQVGRAGKDIRDKILFSPDVIKGTQLYSWALSFDVPFKVTNFLYITSPLVRHIVIGSGALFDELREKIPDELGFEFYGPSFSSIYDENNYRVKFIYVGATLNDGHAAIFSKMKDSEVSAIVLGSSDQITFYQKSGSTWSPSGTSSYIHLESAIAAMFAANKEEYDCGMDKAFKKIRQIATIYYSRSNQLQMDYSADGNSNCATQHSSALLGSLENLKVVSFPNSISTIKTAEIDLDRFNQNAQIYSCALVY